MIIQVILEFYSGEDLYSKNREDEQEEHHKGSNVCQRWDSEYDGVEYDSEEFCLRD